MLARIALGGIWVYQTWLSPYKGYRCAYALRYGGPGCSGFAKHVLRAQGVWHGWPLIRARFAACKDAADTAQTGKNRRKSSRRRDCACEGCSHFPTDALRCGRSGPRGNSTPGTDVGDCAPCEIGGSCC